MGARWNWNAVCPNGHVYGNFSGGDDPCYECGAEPEIVFEGDTSHEEARAYLAGQAVAARSEPLVEPEEPTLNRTVNFRVLELEDQRKKLRKFVHDHRTCLRFQLRDGRGSKATVERLIAEIDEVLARE